MEKTSKADRLIAKGDKLLAKGKAKRALKKFRKAQKLCPENKELYDRLIKAHELATSEWSEKDIVTSVGYLMAKQELENPQIKQLHASLTPEALEIKSKVRALLAAADEAGEAQLIEEIRRYGDKAIYPLLQIILDLKRLGQGEEK